MSFVDKCFLFFPILLPGPHEKRKKEKPSRHRHTQRINNNKIALHSAQRVGSRHTRSFFGQRRDFLSQLLFNSLFQSSPIQTRIFGFSFAIFLWKNLQTIERVYMYVSMYTYLFYLCIFFEKKMEETKTKVDACNFSDKNPKDIIFVSISSFFFKESR